MTERAAVYATPVTPCLLCGCTDNQACMTPDGACSWVFVDRARKLGVCSACVNKLPFHGLRPEVLQFAKSMEAVLKANDHKGGWKKMNRWLLCDRAINEMQELLRALEHLSPEEIAKEATDVANFMMMIVDNLTNQENNT